MENIRKIFEKKIVIFLIQFAISSIIIYSLGYAYTITFDSGIKIESKVVIQLLANYVMFGSIEQFYFMLFVWMIISLIPVFILKKIRKSITMNMITFFIPNFFFYVFLSRNSIIYFNLNGGFLILKTLLLGLIILIESITLPFILKKILKLDENPIIKDLENIKFSAKYTCMNCGTTFSSLPKYCYNCLNKIIQKKTTDE